MVANYLIGLREGLEAALVVSILIAYLVKTSRRDLLPALWAGVGLAVTVSAGFGALLTFGPQGLSFQAQEIIGGSLSIVAVGLVTWMIFWMARTARHLKADLHGKLDDAVAAGRRAVVAMACLAVGREGLETALFLWASAKATTAGASGGTLVPLGGALLGIGTAVVIAALLYRGAVRLDLGAFFAWTGAFLVLVAAGVLSYGVHDLQEAGVLPGLGSLAFDVSATVPPSSWYATLLKGVFNFTPATTWLQLVAWTLYVVPTMTYFVRNAWRRPPARPAAARSDATPADVAPADGAPVAVAGA